MIAGRSLELFVLAALPLVFFPGPFSAAVYACLGVFVLSIRRA